MVWDNEVVIVYDQDCNFCTDIAIKLSDKYNTGLVSFNELTAEQKQQLPSNYEDCAHVIIGGSVYSCGESFEALLASHSTKMNKSIKLYHTVIPKSEYIRELGYNTVANNRSKFSKLYFRLF